MSGYIGTTPRKMVRGWIDIPNKENIEEFVETKDTDFQGGEFTVADVSHGFYKGMKYYELINGQYIITNDTTPRPSKTYYYTEPIKEYYELVDNEYVLTGDFYQDSTTGNWVKNWDSTKTYYERHIHYGSSNIRKIIRKAWVGNANSEPELALYSEQYYVTCRSDSFHTLDIGDSDLLVVYNDEIHVFKKDIGDGDNSSRHYSWNGKYTQDYESQNLWNYIEQVPVDISRPKKAVVYNNKIHILGAQSNTTAHYSWNGIEWTNEGILPEGFEDAVVYDNKIYLFVRDNSNQCKYWYTYDGTSWTQHAIPTTKIKNTAELVGVYNNKIYFFNWGVDSGSSHPLDIFTLDELDNVTKEVTQSLGNQSTCAYIIYNNEIHTLGGFNPNTGSSINEHRSYNGTSWSKKANLPYIHSYNFGFIVYKGSIHFINEYEHFIYKPKDETFAEAIYDYWYVPASIPYPFSDGSMVVYNNKIHILGAKYKLYTYEYYRAHCAYDGREWTFKQQLPYDFYNGGAVVYNNEIHIIGTGAYDGSSLSRYSKYHYKYDPNNGWKYVDDDVPYAFFKGCVVVYHDKIHIIGGDLLPNDYHDYDRYHYSWDGTSWSYESTLPTNYGVTSGCAVVYHDKIYVIGGNHNRDQQINYDPYIMKELYYDSDNSQWVTNLISIPYNITNGIAMVYNNKIHIFGGNDGYKHYSWDGTSWKKEWDIPYKFCEGSGCAFKSEMYLLGGYIPDIPNRDNMPPWYTILNTNEQGYFK